MSQQKKPELKDYGLTDKQVKDNNAVKEKQTLVNRKNEETNSKCVKNCWILFAVTIVIIIIVAASSEDGGKIFGIGLLVSGIVWFLVCKFCQGALKETAPTYNYEIERKYKKYEKDLEEYNKKVSLSSKISSFVPNVSYSQSTPIKAKATATKKTTTSAKNTATTTITKAVSKYNTDDLVSSKADGIGTVVEVDNAKKTVTVKFDNKYTKRFTFVEADTYLTMGRNSQITNNRSVEVRRPIPAKPKESIVKTFTTSNIELTEVENNIFNEMVSISHKYCMDLKIDDRHNIVGLGILDEEQLRFYLIKNKDGSISVKFKAPAKLVVLSADNRSELLSLTRKVNDIFEANPEKYQLAKHKITQVEETIKPAIIEEPDEIFDIEDEEIIVTETIDNEAAEIDYDNKLFTIDGTKLIRFIGRPLESQYSIPDGIKEIGANSFENNLYVFDLKIPYSVERIEDSAFKGCAKLRHLMLPSSIKSIGKDVFTNCTNLETIFCETKAVRKLLTDVPKNVEIVCLEIM